jgi:hypothetical protein
MAVQPETLENQERSLDLKDRAVECGEPRGRRTRPGASAELEALRRRVAEAKNSEPFPAYRHSLDCYRSGWAAAVEKIETTSETTPERVRSSASAELEALRRRLAEAQAAEPLPAYRYCLDCYRSGWAAAVEKIQGGD